MYIVLLDPYSDHVSVITDKKGFVEYYTEYDEAKAKGELALYNKEAKIYRIYEERANV